MKMSLSLTITKTLHVYTYGYNPYKVNGANLMNINNMRLYTTDIDQPMTYTVIHMNEGNVFNSLNHIALTIVL